MERSRRIVLLAHCLLNVNSKVERLARYRGAHPIVQSLAERGLGLLQLPCPELTCAGLKRWPQTVEQYDTPFFRAHCARLAEPVSAQVEEYLRCGYRVGPVIGFEGSPSCGVRYACSGDWGGMQEDEERLLEVRRDRERAERSGVFIEVLRERLEPLGIRFVAVDEREADDGVARVLDLLDET